VKNRALIPLLAVLGALAAPAAAQSAEVGLNIAGGASASPESYAMLDDTGAKWARHFMFWDAVDERILREGYDRIVANEDRRGVKTLLVVAGLGGRPPADPAAYARFMGSLAARYKGRVEAYEVWNEQDEGIFWKGGGDPAAYVRLLKAAHKAIKAGDPGAKVIFGPTTGNNYRFVSAAYKAGAKGSFDAVAVHTDTGCLTRAPSEFYREEDGRLGQYTFLGYREVRRVMEANGDAKPIWMTELGWSAATHTCDRGSTAGTKPAGVGERKQAENLREAYRCLSEDAYVEVALWFNDRDLVGDLRELNSYGLKRFDGSLRPAYAAFKDVARNGPGAAGGCGDFAAPRIRVLRPTAGTRVSDGDTLPIKATSPDADVVRMTFRYGANDTIRSFSNDNGAPLDFSKVTPAWTWSGIKKLGYGTHRVVIVAYDRNGNEGRQEILVEKVRPGRMPRTRTKFTKVRLRGSGRSRVVTGRLVASRPVGVPGKVKIKWQAKRGGSWRTVHRWTKSARGPFRFKQRLRHGGAWRVRVEFPGRRPYGSSRTGWLKFTA
jgi:hypothetical protein